MTDPLISIVVPVHNEAENIEPLVPEIAAAFDGVAPYEIIYVDDASTDATLEKLTAMKARFPQLRVISNQPGKGRLSGVPQNGTRSPGKVAAMRTGAKAARGRYMATIDGDCQDDPKDLVKFLERIQKGDVALVGGVRVKRHDNASRLIASKIGNGIRQFILRDGCPDTACGVKLFEREAFLDLPGFGSMQRYLPFLFQMHGYKCDYIPVNHRSRTHGSSKYTNWQRALVGIVDMMGVVWLRARAFTANSREV